MPPLERAFRRPGGHRSSREVRGVHRRRGASVGGKVDLRNRSGRCRRRSCKVVHVFCVKSLRESFPENVGNVVSCRNGLGQDVSVGNVTTESMVPDVHVLCPLIEGGIETQFTSAFVIDKQIRRFRN